MTSYAYPTKHPIRRWLQDSPQGGVFLFNSSEENALRTWQKWRTFAERRYRLTLTYRRTHPTKGQWALVAEPVSLFPAEFRQEVE